MTDLKIIIIIIEIGKVKQRISGLMSGGLIRYAFKHSFGSTYQGSCALLLLGVTAKAVQSNT